MLGRRSARLLAAGAVIFVCRVHFIGQPTRMNSKEPASAVVAVCLSGVSRDETSLRLSLASLHQQLMQPARGVNFTVFSWFEDDYAEASLAREFMPNYPTFLRRNALEYLPPNLRPLTDSVLEEHGLLSRERIVVNTLRMLRKLSGAEWLRRYAEGRLGFPRATLVLRARPDMMLMSVVPIPVLQHSLHDVKTSSLDASPGAISLPWACNARGLIFDQFFALSPSRASSVLDDAFDVALSLVRHGEQIYPEAFFFNLLKSLAYEIVPWPVCMASSFSKDCVAFRAALVSQPSGIGAYTLDVRDPFATLRADYPDGHCQFPSPLTDTEIARARSAATGLFYRESNL